VPEAKVVACHGCGRDLGYEGQLSRGAVCEGCGIDLRCCLNCCFHDPAAYNQCGEPAAERVVEKEAANFCDFFSGTTRVRSPTAPSEGRSELERMFKK
jgi:hypothetical protein